MCDLEVREGRDREGFSEVTRLDCNLGCATLARAKGRIQHRKARIR